ncbi:hypothetical protein CKY04_05845 [Photorhabdus sp. S8-52]|nr:hypothetical protein CKY03_05700 [Photorhabdus sp. S9-53]RAX01972.1 hypothetical protein CKY05_04940 [Photorhabdus sp. S10-54]RAX05106.1 hypothetical protein CKY04_05845 [Photorhabdus sp. S8-52]
MQVVSIDAHKNKMGGRKVDIGKEKGATLSCNPLIYLVELAGVEPALIVLHLIVINNIFMKYLCRVFFAAPFMSYYWPV